MGNEITPFVAIDLGASSTRYVSTAGKVRFLDNNVVMIKDIDRQMDNEVLDSTPENNLDVVITKDGESEIFPIRAFLGNMASRLFSSQLRPSNLKNKVDQPINYVSALVAVALSKLYGEITSDDINLFVALPPSEVANHKDRFINQMKGKYTVKFNKIGASGTDITFNIAGVACYEESRMALMQFFFDPKHPENLSKYGSCNMLSIDIGASTTDLVVFMDGKYLNITGRTYKIGGNIVRDYVMRALSAEYAMELSTEDANKCLAEGRMPFGNSYKPIDDIIGRAKEEVARQIVSKMDPYFGSIGIPLTSMNYIVVSGGGSMGSSYIDADGKPKITSKPMSEYITTVLKDICDGIEVVQFDDEPRLANIRGLATTAMIKKGII